MAAATITLVVLVSAALWANYKNGHLPFKPKQFGNEEDSRQTQIPQVKNQEVQAPEIWTANGSDGNNAFGLDQSWQDLNPPQDPNAASCPEDISSILKLPIIENEYLDRISPLGHVKGDDRMHVIPISHIYYVNSKPAQIFSPADLWFESIDRLTQIDASGKAIWSDFNIYMSPCKEIRIEFDHVRNLSDAFAQMLNESEEHCSTDPPTTKRRYETCHAEIKKEIKMGDPIGWGGGYGNLGLDVSAYDVRIKNPFISPERYRFPHLQGICFLDLYSGSLKEFLYDKIETPEGGKRMTEPRCGSIAQDVSGTVQGEWFIGNISADQAEREGKVLSIVHFEFDPLPGIVATSGTLVLSPGMLAFAPRHEGLVNREPSEIKDSNIYCFQHEQRERMAVAYSSVKPFTGRILIQLVDSKTLKAEYQEKSCDESFNFNTPTAYER